MSDSTPGYDPIEKQDLLANGLDDGTGDPNDDRAYLMDQPPAKVDDEAVREHEDENEADEEE